MSEELESKIVQGFMTDGHLHPAAIPSWLEAQPEPQNESIFEEAERLTESAREEDYGSPKVHFEDVAIMWSAHIRAKYGIEITLNTHDIAWMMANLKQCRAMHKVNRDTLVDAIGYIGLVNRL